jgi:hypothetical protein
VFGAGLYGAMLFLILASLCHDNWLRLDLTAPMSAGKAFGEFLAASPEYRDAILLPEPDYTIEPVPYYAHNLIYFAREQRFGTTVTRAWTATVDLSLGTLVATAEALKRQYGQPVLVVLGHPDAVGAASGDIWYSYNKHFTWNADDRASADRSLVPVTTFTNAVNDERYWVYAVR